MHAKFFLLLALLLAASSLMSAQDYQTNDNSQIKDELPTGRGLRPLPSPAPVSAQQPPQNLPPGATPPPRNNGISYHYGALITGGTNVYYIWYGDWSDNTATTILPDLAGSIGGSPYFNINTTYYDLHGTRISNQVAYKGSVNDNYSRGTKLADWDISTIVASHVGHDLPFDLNGVYFVLTSADVHETTGFCTSYCGWHSTSWYGNDRIHFAFVGNPDQCPNACESQRTISPNGNPAADGMASIFSHELEESTTDADLSAWYDSYGNENADKCAWHFGATQKAANGSNYNVVLGGKEYLIQQNWVNARGGYCSLSF